MVSPEFLRDTIMNELFNRSRLISILILFAAYWTLVLSSEYLNRLWPTTPVSITFLMIFLVFLVSLAWLSFLVACLPQGVSLFLIILAALASAAANVYCNEYGVTVTQESLEALEQLSGAEILSMASGLAVFWITMLVLPVILYTFLMPEEFSPTTRLSVFSLGMVSLLIAVGLWATVVPLIEIDWPEWNGLWELVTPGNLILAAMGS